MFEFSAALSPFQALRSFKVTVSVEPKFHPKIIGRKGAVISQIRKDHDVSIQFPDKGDEQQVCVCLCYCCYVDKNLFPYSFFFFFNLKCILYAF